MAAKISVFLLTAIITRLMITMSQSFTASTTTTTATSQTSTYQGKWRLLKRSIGISAMHMALLPNDRIIVFDRTNFGPSNITLPKAKCRESAITPSDYCFAHSVEFNPSKRAVRPLSILTDTWCSSGALSSDGILVQTGGFEAGERVVRYFEPCSECDWEENPNGLSASRWYASNQVLPDGKIIIVGGRLEFSYEFIPKTSASEQLHKLPFLEETRYSAKVPNNLYPFLHLSPDGNLFIFANDRAILLDYVNHKVIRQFPTMPDGNGVVSRNYPSTGSSSLLPILLSQNDTAIPNAVVLVCGGTASDSNVKASAGEHVPATKTCGRISITEEEPQWEMEEMPIERVMGDMILLPTGDVLIINGARRGTAGWNVAREPVLNPVLYRTGRDAKTRFEILSPSSIPRLYHSTAHLLSDGRVLVGGSNPNRNYNFSTMFPTELSLEAFYPPYLTMKSRPLITKVEPGAEMNYNQSISVRFRSKGTESVTVTMFAPSFTTHSFAMNQRLLILDVGKVSREKEGIEYVVNGYAPPTPAVAPPGYYLIFVVVDGVPSSGRWVRIK